MRRCRGAVIFLLDVVLAVLVVILPVIYLNFVRGGILPCRALLDRGIRIDFVLFATRGGWRVNPTIAANAG